MCDYPSAFPVSVRVICMPNRGHERWDTVVASQVMRQGKDCWTPRRWGARPVRCWANMCVSEPRQVEKGVDTRMLLVDNWCLKEARRSPTRTDQHLSKFREGERIRGEACTGAMNGAVRLCPVILNVTFRP